MTETVMPPVDPKPEETAGTSADGKERASEPAGFAADPVPAPDRDALVIAREQITSLIGRQDHVQRRALLLVLLALFSAAIGLALLLLPLLSLRFARLSELEDLSTLSRIGGLAAEAIAAVLFYLYRKMLAYGAELQMPIDRLRRYLLAIALCERMKPDARPQAYTELVKTIAGPGLVEP